MDSLPATISHCRLITAMVTPFTDSGDAVDHPALTTLARHLVNNQANDGLLVNGTTGESPTTSLPEKIEILKTVKAAVDVPVMTGAGGNSTRLTIDAAVELAQAGADALLVVVPYYNKPSQAGMVAHLTAVAQAVSTTPIVIYNIPSRTGVCMAPETMAALHQACPNIVGVKQSHPDMVAVTEITRQLPKSFTVWSGDDPLTLPMLACGASGVISVLGHVAGPSIQAMMSHHRAGQPEQACGLHQQLLTLGEGLFTLPNPTIVKSLLHKQGVLPNNTFRLPMVPPTPEETANFVTPLLNQLSVV